MSNQSSYACNASDNHQSGDYNQNTGYRLFICHFVLSLFSRAQRIVLSKMQGCNSEANPISKRWFKYVLILDWVVHRDEDLPDNTMGEWHFDRKCLFTIVLSLLIHYHYIQNVKNYFLHRHQCIFLGPRRNMGCDGLRSATRRNIGGHADQN